MFYKSFRGFRRVSVDAQLNKAVEFELVVNKEVVFDTLV